MLRYGTKIATIIAEYAIPIPIVINTLDSFLNSDKEVLTIFRFNFLTYTQETRLATKEEMNINKDIPSSLKRLTNIIEKKAPVAAPTI